MVSSFLNTEPGIRVPRWCLPSPSPVVCTCNLLYIPSGVKLSIMFAAHHLKLRQTIPGHPLRMAPADSPLLPHNGTLGPSSAPFLLDDDMGFVKPFIIVFAVFCILGLVTIPILIFRIHQKSPPFPPIQPLAHYRERESKYLPQPYLPHESMGPDWVSNTGSERVALEPRHIQRFRSMESTSPPSSVESYLGEHACAAQQYISTTRLARSSSLSRPRPRHDISRKSSTSSTRTTSTHASMRSMNVIRGAPHSPLNDIEIVLPVPLAPQLQSYMIEDPSTTRRGSPICDLWMAALISTTSWPSDTDQALSAGDTSRKRQSCSSSGFQDRRDQLGCLESKPRSREGDSSRCVIRPQPPYPGDPIIPGNNTRSLGVTSQVSCDKQGISTARPPRYIFAEELHPQPSLKSQNRCPTCLKPTRSRPLPQLHRVFLPKLKVHNNS